MKKDFLKVAPSFCKKLSTPFKVDAHLKALLDTIESAGGFAVLVGGCVRDHLLGQVAKDLDLEVYGLSSDQLEKILSHTFKVTTVGKSFGIFLVCVDINGERKNFDVALPRTENKMGTGHKGFNVSCDENLSFVDASTRRDFTVNAMAINLQSQELVDPHGGQKDLEKKVLRHVSQAFVEDPLRVLRAAQFCARFEMSLDQKTIELCQKLEPELSTLSKERIFGEFKKLLLAKKPSIGLSVLRQTNALNLFPELKALINVQQDKEWHPEGDVWVHSLMVTDEAAALAYDDKLCEEDHLVVVTGALCHDFGKPSTTIEVDGRIKSPAHEQAGVEPTEKFLERIYFPKKLIEKITPLVKEHLKPHQLYSKRDEVSDGAIRRLSNRVNINDLLYVSRADFLGRTTKEALSRFDPSEPWLRKRAEELNVSDQKPKPILQGRHLIEEGLSPGKSFAKILDLAFEDQLDGKIKNLEQAKDWLKKYLEKNNS